MEMNSLLLLAGTKAIMEVLRSSLGCCEGREGRVQ